MKRRGISEISKVDKDFITYEMAHQTLDKFCNSNYSTRESFDTIIKR